MSTILVPQYMYILPIIDKQFCTVYMNYIRLALTYSLANKQISHSHSLLSTRTQFVYTN